NLAVWRIRDIAFLRRRRDVDEVMLFEVVVTAADRTVPVPLQVRHAVRRARSLVRRKLRLLRDPRSGLWELRRIRPLEGLRISAGGSSGHREQEHHGRGRAKRRIQPLSHRVPHRANAESRFSHYCLSRYAAHSYSRGSMSFSCRRYSGMLIFHGRVNTFGSSTVTSYSMWSGPVRVKRSTRCSASLWKFPARSNHVSSLKCVTSTTSVLPSQRPRESPMYQSMFPAGWGVRLM